MIPDANRRVSPDVRREMPRIEQLKHLDDVRITCERGHHSLTSWFPGEEDACPVPHCSAEVDEGAVSGYVARWMLDEIERLRGLVIEAHPIIPGMVRPFAYCKTCGWHGYDLDGPAHVAAILEGRTS